MLTAKFIHHTSTDRTTCERCLTTNYCVGDGSSLPCGRCEPPQANSTCGRSPTEHSFGLASECTTCPLGWLCKDGYAEPCPEFHYINCTDSDCPDQCYPCEPGYACRKGERFECPEGTYSNATVARCELCDAGTYQDERGKGSCKACLTGYESSINRQRCDVCSRRTYLDIDTKTCTPCTLWSQCPCIADTSLCYQKTHCHNYQTGPSTYSYSCLPCPDGFTGDGATCLDIDECVVYKPCWNSSTCINTSPGYQCMACPRGYIGTYEDALTIDIHRRTFYWRNKVLSPENQTCTDIDECLVNNGGCDVNAYCHNTIGSFYCGECLPGYIGNPVVGCRIGDFCLSGENNCNVNADCLVTGLGEFRCVCRTGWAGDGIYCGKDSDGDGISDTIIPCSSDSCLADNCQYVANGGQEDNDNDKKGDVCDDDDDNDFIADVDDNCQYVANRLQSDIDGDGRGNDCDNCINDVNYDQSDVDDDGVGDVCDDDIDGDSILNGADNCPYEANLAQTDVDGDTVGDSCDNCKNVSNIGQTDTNQNAVGDSCDGQDSDGDGVIDYMDNCVYFPNSVQTDSDNDGSGDTCDDDIDGDGVLNKDDNCVYVPNPGQEMLIGHQTRGDACVQDMDADGTPDLDDLCPYHKNVATASFSRYFTLDLNPSWTTEDSPEWAVLNKGRDIHQSKSTLKPVALIGKQIFDHVTLTGTTFVDSNEGYGVIGFIIGYQSNRKYYLLTWRHKSFNLIDRGNVKGVQIWLVDSGIAPSTSYAYALYHGCDTAGITTLLWQDPNLTGWELGQGYKWTIEHIPSLGALRVCVDHDNNILVDSGYVLDVSIPGGRLGVFSYNQTGSHWSNLQYHCTQRLNKALHLNGVAYGEIGTFSQLSIEHSFSLETWVYLTTSDLTMKQPILCSVSDDVCLYIRNSTFHIKVGTSITDGTSVIMGDTWTHVLTVYEAQSNKVTIFVNGTNGQATQDNRSYSIPFLTLNATDILYLGRDNDNFFHGLMDEVKIYNTAILDADIDTYWTKFDMTREFKKCILSAHYNMDNQTQTTFLEDKGLRHLDVRLHGNPSFVESTTDYQRFYDSIT
ncbi:cartilage oligomeric matrix protein-like [Argopecten irradians]|uniref:cartilage oligomeric matrix protein-like n=1 Tax=Argopecten irradians TaxID=31199 RepID=UPI0037102452